MDPSLLSLIAVAGTATSVLAGVLAANAFSTARLLGATGPTPIGELTANLHEVRGTVVGVTTRQAPVSGRTCVFWRLLVEQQRRTRWEVVLDVRDGATIYLQDETGRVQIDPREAEAVATSAARFRTGVFAHPSPEWTDVVARVGEPSRPPATNFLRWREEVFEEGDPLTAIGRAQAHPDGWELVPADGALMLSDRNDIEVVRQHRRNGRRWAGIAFVAVLIALIAGFSTFNT